MIKQQNQIKIKYLQDHEEKTKNGSYIHRKGEIETITLTQAQDLLNKNIKIKEVIDDKIILTEEEKEQNQKRIDNEDLGDDLDEEEEEDEEEDSLDNNKQPKQNQNKKQKIYKDHNLEKDTKKTGLTERGAPFIISTQKTDKEDGATSREVPNITDTQQSGSDTQQQQKEELERIKKLMCGYETFAEFKIYHDIQSIQTNLNLKETEIKNIFNSELRKTKEKQKPKPKKNNSFVDRFQLITVRGKLNAFYLLQPFYYDKSKIFWLWNKKESEWEISDETDFCNLIYKELNIDTINTKAKSELIEGFKQVGREKAPKKLSKEWIQFKDKIINIKTGEQKQATSEYFLTNSIPHKIGKNEETPTIDRLFEEWVEEKFIPTLYQIVAYVLTTDKFMQRIIALCGGGSNGKGTFIKLIEKFIGKKNLVASDIRTLSEGRFETARLYKKLLCVMGEVQYDDLKNTNKLKKLGGEDSDNFEFKGKDGITDDHTVTCICLTNSLPITPDQTDGFHRKWCIIDFPNQFQNINSNLIDTIPQHEFENLAKKSIRILKELYENPKFIEEGTIEERRQRYEERSDPLQIYLDSNCIEDSTITNPVSLRDFSTAFNEYLKNKHLRQLQINKIGKQLRDKGYNIQSRKILETQISYKAVLGLKLSKTTKTTKTT